MVGTERLSVIFTAGCLGGLVNSLVVWLFGLVGITTGLGVAIAPNLTPGWLYPRIVWGGIWAALFLLPFLKGSAIRRGCLYSLGPTAIQLFLIYPLQAGKSMLGLDLGSLTPLFVIFFNAVWGIAAGLWIRSVDARA